MSQVYAEYATGDYLWQIDVDEFYKAEDIQAMVDMIRADPTITVVSFQTLTFFGAPHYIVDSWQSRRRGKHIERIFKWGDGYKYGSHRPPTVYLPNGVDARQVNWIRSKSLARRNIFMYHYSLLFPKQVIEKCDYYGHVTWNSRSQKMQWWADNCYMQLKHPFRVHIVYTSPGWLERYHGKHPEQILAMWDDINTGVLDVARRRTEDIEKLISSIRYQVGRSILKVADYPDRVWTKFKNVLRVVIPPKIIRLFKRIFHARSDA
jgi:hypothetical protein